MYYLFMEKNLLPGDYYNLKEGEKMVIRAFYEFTMEQRMVRKEEVETMERIKRLKNR